MNKKEAKENMKNEEKNYVTIDGFQFNLLHVIPAGIRKTPVDKIKDICIYVIRDSTLKLYLVSHRIFSENDICTRSFNAFKSILEQDEVITSNESEALLIAQNSSMKTLIDYQNDVLREMSSTFDKLKSLNETILSENERINNTLSAFWRCQEELKKR